MTKAKYHTVRLLNRSFDIKCPEGEQDNLHLAAQKLNELLTKKKAEFTKLDDFQALVLTALHISHELVTCQTQQNEHRQQLTQFISNLENKINQVAK
jgi:cell division protein ZapA